MIKQVIVIRSDLRNTKGQKIHTGKIIAQACHASIAFLTKKFKFSTITSIQKIFRYFGYSLVKLTDSEKEWIEGIFTKVCLKVDSDQGLLDIYHAALAAGLNADLIQDKGLTEFGGIPTYTCLAIGPDLDSLIDPITKHLSLY